ncbi:MAG: hypothetical protein PUK35_02490 [Methanomassiliicoccales archaeon]|uniref:hypothetical protein n=1 Tax=Candidatus Methanarcanum hacksteinii TaxID=2911857 RepID=UPI0015B2CAFC|nr:hypothetical protein [Candidatus Methanomethylophilaceae archaeon]MDD7478711.1 hypothetical protein [Methanomassiliicoccales archaeon]MDY4580622.1 hypothetical protein [Candidatus Methanarcanum hacksteinii]
MTTEDDLQRQVDSLKKEVEGLKEFVRALYNMIIDEESDDEEYVGGIEFGRYNT